MVLQRTSREIWREHATSVKFLLERAETEGGRAGGSFGPRIEQLIGTATALRLTCRRCDGDKGHHTSKEHEFDPRPATRVAYTFVWVQGSGARGEIELDITKSPIWEPYTRPR
jgi:hypothetical protein